MHDMLPILEFGPWRLPTYSLLAALGLLVAGMYGFHRLLRLQRPQGIILRGFALALGVGALGPFLVYALPRLRHMLWPNSPQPTEGLSIIWALVGGTLAAAAYCLKYRLPLARALDLGLLPVPLGLAIGRLGCYAAGCCAGKPTDSWLGVYLRNADGVWAVRYPAQLWSVAADLLIFVTLVAVERCGEQRASREARARPSDGRLALLFLGLYSLKRFLVAFVRESAVPLIGPFSAMQLYALAGLLVFAMLTTRRLAKSALSA
jgi:phosphatidylglycerol---prolipoprotein diacylglyceryl transferase